jgi:hypothetical protein
VSGVFFQIIEISVNPKVQYIVTYHFGVEMQIAYDKSNLF